MIPWLNIHTLTYLAWGLVNTSLVVQLGQQAQWGVQPQLPVPAVAEQVFGELEIETMPEYRLPALQKNFKETLTRPLFVPSRSEAPPIPPPPPPPKPTMQKGQFQLVGTTIADESKSAILKEISSGKERQVHQGFTINGILLDLVEPDRIVISQYDDREELKLKIQRSAKNIVTTQGAKAGSAPVIPSISSPAVQTAERTPARVSPSVRMEPLAPIVIPPQTVEDRAKNPLFKDFFSK